MVIVIRAFSAREARTLDIVLRAPFFEGLPYALPRISIALLVSSSESTPT
jgi:hypothetical protein